MTIVDGLIASRDALYHSANYRSAVAFGTAREVADRDEKEAVLERMTRRYFPGRTVGEHYRAPSDKDLKITSLLAIEVEELNGKRRTGPPAGPADADESPDAFGTRGDRPGLPDRRGRPRRVARGLVTRSLGAAPLSGVQVAAKPTAVRDRTR